MSNEKTYRDILSVTIFDKPSDMAWMQETYSNEKLSKINSTRLWFGTIGMYDLLTAIENERAYLLYVSYDTEFDDNPDFIDVVYTNDVDFYTHLCLVNPK